MVAANLVMIDDEIRLSGQISRVADGQPWHGADKAPQGPSSLKCGTPPSPPMESRFYLLVPGAGYQTGLTVRLYVLYSTSAL